MSQVNFSSILDKPSNEVRRQKPLPVGSYIGIVTDLPRIDKSTKKGTEFSEYIIKVISADEDVDEDDLKDALTKPSGEVQNLRDKTVRVTFYHTDNSLPRLRKFFDHLDIPEEDEDGNPLTMRQRMQLVPNRQVGFYVTHTASDDGEDVYGNVEKTFKVE